MSNPNEPSNTKKEFSICPKCGGQYVHESFMVSDGFDDVDWDFNDYCSNPLCPSNQFLIDTQTEFGMVKDEPLNNLSKIL